MTKKYKAPKRLMKEPIYHNHTGSMVYLAEKCWCSDCGQRWHLKRSNTGNPQYWETI